MTHIETVDFNYLRRGNDAFITSMNENLPGLLEAQARYPQRPPFLFLGCADSRVSEGTVFNAIPGALFGERNIANQFRDDDASLQATLAFAVTALGVTHIIVLGHYECGGCAAAMNYPWDKSAAPPLEVQEWILPIVELYKGSQRTEIAEYKAIPADLCEPVDEYKGLSRDDKAYNPLRALIEENVRNSVNNIYKSKIIQEHYKKLANWPPSGHPGATAPPSPLPPAPQPVFIHGFVYDLVLEGVISP